MKEYLKLNNEVLNTYTKTGKIDREKDKEATRKYFLEEVNVKMRYFIDLEEKLKYLVNEGYYEKEFLEMYDFKFIKKIYKLAYSYNFRFPSFMSASKFYTSYAMKSRDGKEILEKYEDRVAIIALYLARGDEQLAINAVKSIMTAYQPATPTALNSGKQARGELVSCFPGDTKVKTINGEINISELSVDDLVLTHNGHYKKVTGVKVSEYEDTLITLDVTGQPNDITSTKEHPFMIYRATSRQNKLPLNPILRGDGETSNIKWVKAEEIMNGDMVVVPFEKLKGNDEYIDIYDFLSDDIKSKVNIDDDGNLYLMTVDDKNNKLKNNNIDLKSNKVKNRVKLGEEFGRYLGYFLSEGYVHESNGAVKGVRFTFDKKYKLIQEDTQELSIKLFGIKTTFNENKDGSVNVCSWSLILGDFIKNITGTGFDKKLISKSLIRLMGKKTAKGLCIGLFRGDGTINKSTIALDLSNVKLIKQIQDLMFNVGVITYRFEYISNSGTPSARLNVPMNNLNNIEFIKSVKKGELKDNYVLSDCRSTWLDGYALFKVNDVKLTNDKLKVYNLEVENDHTYTANGILVHNCFKISMDDTMNSIAENIGYCLELSRLGGGVGVLLTDLRPLGDPIKGIENRASGVMPVAKLLENSFSYSNQMGQRNGSGVIYLNVFHGDIEDFISAKKPNADEKIRLATLSTGVILPDIFFELMRKDKDIITFSPYDIYKEYGKRMSEISMTEMYYELLDNPKIRKLKRINARKLYSEIKKSQFESGYPFEIFDDNVNNAHPLKDIGRVKMSNLCTEVLQLMTTSIINDQDKPHEYGLDVSCNLGSIDIHEAVKVNDFEKLIDTSMKLLTNVSDMTNIVNVPSVVNANRKMHSIGLGIMNANGHLASQGILYGSKESIQFIDLFMEAMNYYSIKSSMNIAKERKETFLGFEKSEYAKGTYFDNYITDEVKVINSKVEKALGNVPTITTDMWKELKKDVMTYGLYHAYRICIAPTGSISYIRSCTASLSPVTEKVEIRDYSDSRTIYPMPFLNNDNFEMFPEAYDINVYDMIDMYATAQKHVDQGISMTLYVTDKWDTEQLAKAYIYAWSKGIKTVYYVRQRLTTIDGVVDKAIAECVSCSI